MGISTNEVVHYALETAAFAGVIWWMASTNSKFNSQIQDLKKDLAAKDQKIKELEDKLNILYNAVGTHSQVLRAAGLLQVPAPNPPPVYPPPPSSIPMPIIFQVPPQTEEKQEERIIEVDDENEEEEERPPVEYDTEKLDAELSEELKDFNSISNSSGDEEKKNG